MTPHYKDRKVAVIGLAHSGIAAACLLQELGAEVFISDNACNEKVKALAEDLHRQGIVTEIGGHCLDSIRDKDLVVVSPGVSAASPALKWANELGIPVISEIELAWSLCPATVIAITGTNGKTTVTTLVAKVLEAAGKKAVALGNIGKPFSQEVMNLGKDDFVSLEVSSFQLETIRAFKPKVSVILNFTPDHLDRYKDIQEYLSAKKRIFMNQDENDYTVLNYDDLALRALAGCIKAKTVFFSANESIKRTENRLKVIAEGDFLGAKNSADDIKRKRALNPNHFAVMAAAKIFNIPETICDEVFRNFKGVEHRMELVRTFKKIDFINDSKATNVDSTMWALRNIYKPAILIAGGRDKNSDYAVIFELMRQKVKLLVVIGEARGKILKALGGFGLIQEASSLEEAVALGFEKAKSGDCLLLSPMCASFDMFENYEHRGKVFKDIVNKLK